MSNQELTQRQRMQAGLPYLPTDSELVALHHNCQQKLDKFNALPICDHRGRTAILQEIVGKCGKTLRVEGPFFCDYGFNIEIGENFFANYLLTILDVGKVSIGNDVLFGPNVAIYAVGHVIDPDLRRQGYEFGLSVTIGNNVWVGGSTVFNPGVNIGENSVIGAGSVVTRDIPANVIAAGNPAHVLREICERDKIYYWRDRKYGVSSVFQAL